MTYDNGCYDDYESDVEYNYNDDELDYDSDYDEVVSEPSLIPEKLSSRNTAPRVPTPIQLSSKNSKFKTLQEVKVHYQNLMEEEKRESEKKEIDMMVKYTLNQMEIERIEHQKLMAMIPTESEACKAKRIQKEAEEKLQKEKEQRKAYKKKGKMIAKAKAEHARKEKEEIEAAKLKRSEKRASRRAEKMCEQTLVKPEPIPSKPVKIADPEHSEPKSEPEKEIVKTIIPEQQPNKGSSSKKSEPEKEIVKTIIPEQQPNKGSSSKKEPLVIKMGASPYNPAPFIPKGKPSITPPSDLTCTKMCRSVFTNKHCYHGERCRFAHSIEQLNPSKCGFGNMCDKIICDDFSCRNNPLRFVCEFIHPNETKETFCDRIGVTPKNIIPVIPPAKFVTRDVKYNEVVGTTPSEKICQPCTSKLPAKQRMCSFILDGSVCPHAKCRFSHTKSLEEFVLKVPEELAIQSVEIALKNGHKNIL